MNQKSRNLIVVACFVSLLSGASEDLRRSGNKIRLFPQQAVTHALNGRPQLYSFDLKKEDFFTLSVVKPGAGVAVTLLKPDGSIIRSIQCSHEGSLQISEIAERPGRYTARLKSCDSAGASIPFQLQLSSSARATELDQHRVRAERLSAEADLLVAEYRATSRQMAIKKYREALRLWQVVSNPSEESILLARIAKLHGDAGDFSLADDFVDQALAASRRARDPSTEVEALLAWAAIRHNQGDTSQALEFANQALEKARSIRDQRLEGEAQYQLGTIRYDRGDYSDATLALQEAQTISVGRANPLAAARAILYLGAVDFDLRRFDAAREKGFQALPVFPAFHDWQGEARALTFLGHFHSQAGRTQEAMNLFQKASDLTGESGDFYTETSLLNGIARVHFDLGDAKTASQFFKLTLAKNRAWGDKLGIAFALRSLGHCFFADGNTTDALASLNEALRTFRSIPHKMMVGIVLQDIGITLERAGHRAQALEYLVQSLDISHSLKDRRMEAWTLTSMGHIADAMANPNLALDYYRKAQSLHESVGDRLGRLTVLPRIAVCLRQMGRLEEALALSQDALAEIEGFRATVANSGLRISYFASVHEQYELVIDLLMKLSQINKDPALSARAFEISEKSRARTLVDSIGEAGISISEGIDSVQRQREASLQSQLDKAVERYTQLRNANGNSRELSALSDEIGRLRAQSNEVQAQIKQSSPRYASLVRPEPLTLAQVQADVLDNNSRLLEYTLGDEASFLWVISKHEFKSFVLPGRSEIERRVREFRELVTANLPLPGETPEGHQTRLKIAESQYSQIGAELSRILLEPAAGHLGAGRLVIVADGALQYLPFAALPTPESLNTLHHTALVMNHEVVRLPSASTLAVIRHDVARAKPDRVLAVFADPVFGITDSRVAKQASLSAAGLGQLVRGGQALTESIGLPRLFQTRKEADAILNMVPENSRFAALGFDATKSAVTDNPELKRFRILHFASHTRLIDDQPELSSLLLSLVDEMGNPQDGYLRLSDMYNLRIAAELVVLSACETDIGKDVKGEGLISMVRGFMYAGTPRVLASLWKVDDDATAELMKEFYTQLLQNKLAPAAALREAQLTQMRKNSRRSPFYWAGFQLQGEWN